MNLPWWGLMKLTLLMLAACGVMWLFGKESNAIAAIVIFLVLTVIICGVFWLWEWSTPKQPTKPKN